MTAPKTFADTTFTPPELIRNFCIIAHIDHGKSTLADRMLQLTGVVEERAMRAQYLDRMDIERERGITIKAQNVRLPWQVDGKDHVLHLIDTPGHVDFTYEVSRALEACEGAILLVDAAQGIEAQTLANLYLALENDLHIIPVLNKIDLPSADPEKYAAEIAHIIGCEPSDVLRVSAKTGMGVTELLDECVRQVPPPVGDADAPARAMIFDSVYDTYRGVVTYIRVVDGKITPREKIKMMSTGATHELLEVGIISPEPKASKGLGVGEVGYLITGVKDVRQSKVGDTVTSERNGAKEALAGYRDPKPMVFSGLYPVDGSDYPELREALEKLQLNDAALTYEPETSVALGSAPLRLPRPAAPGDHPRPAGARVRPGPDLDRAERGVPRGAGGPQRGDRHEPVGLAERAQDRRGARAGVEGEHPRAVGVRGHDHGTVPGEARHPAGHGLPVRGPRRTALHDPAGGDHLRLLRHAEVAHARLRVAGLRGVRRAGGGPGEGRHPAAGRDGGRVLRDRAQGRCLYLWKPHGDAPAGTDSAPAVRGPDPGGDRLAHHRARNDPRHPQGRPGEVLRRRHLAEAETAGEAEGRQEAHEDRRPGGGAAGSVRRGTVH
ncbi:GTP-binding protein LepA [Streptomyces sp. AA4]|nr:GTP-binding protein LepA [Streptomyces sp. AA4]